MTPMTTRQFGRNGPQVSSLGLGGSGFGHNRNEIAREAAIRTIHAALER